MADRRTVEELSPAWRDALAINWLRIWVMIDCRLSPMSRILRFETKDIFPTESNNLHTRTECTWDYWQLWIKNLSQTESLYLVIISFRQTNASHKSSTAALSLLSPLSRSLSLQVQAWPKWGIYCKFDEIKNIYILVEFRRLFGGLWLSPSTGKNCPYNCNIP